jgi:hypothetical protein
VNSHAGALARAGADRSSSLLRRASASLASGRGALLCLIGIAVFSTALRVALLSRVHAPTVFMDELGYQRLAQSLGQSGRLALFNKEGLSDSPLYSAILAPIYALGASAPTAYQWIKIVNAVLISLSLFPIYKIARFVLPRRASLLVATLSSLAPLMNYSSFVMSENLAYPLFLVAVWAMLAAVRDPGPRNDAVLLVSIVFASAARIQQVALFPAALTAVVLAAVLGREPLGKSATRSVLRSLEQHWLLIGSGAALSAFAGIAALAGHGVVSLTGVYSSVGTGGVPNPWRVLELTVQHLAGLDLALGVFPFVGTLVAAYAFFRYGAQRAHVVFASVAVAVTVWLLVEIGFFADFLLRDSQANLPRLHERYLIYLVPLFLVALLAAVRIPEAKASVRVYLAAAAPAALLPALIPFNDVINISSVVDSFGLQLLGRAQGGAVVPIPHVTVAAVWIAATFALMYVVLRKRMRGVVVLALFVSVLVSSVVRTRIEAASTSARSVLPVQHRDWVDRAEPEGDVILITGAGAPTAALETAFNNLSIARVYYVCDRTFGGEFGEQQISIDEAGRLRDQSGYVSAYYAVVPAALGVRGRVVARNTRGHQVLVAPANGRLGLPPAKRAKPSCS